jgi:dihydrofolate synthase/folylpolyglutamate synthase
MRYRETLTKLFDLQKFGVKVGLETTRSLLSSLGHPEKGRFVHVAGTNGKGSTAAFLEAILKAGGYKVGLYTSPHLVTFRERIRVDGIMVTEAETLDLFNRVWAVVDESKPPTFFEFVTAMAFLYFQDRAPDLAIIEAGLGGRLDSTNVIDPLLAAITNISLEHTEHLGPTVAAIAGEKAGIIKNGVPLVAGRLEGEALAVVKARLAEIGSPGLFLGQDYSLKASEENGLFDYQGPKWRLKGLSWALAGPYQAENAAMAVALAEALGSRDFPLTPAAVAEGLRKVDWPGRAERFEPGAWPPNGVGRAPLVLDGAHNPGGAQAFGGYLAQAKANQVNQARQVRQIHLIVGVMADKDVAGVLSPLLPQADRLYLTRPEYDRAAAPEELRRRLEEGLGPLKIPAQICPNIPTALAAAAAAASPEDLVVVSGSLFTVGETLAYLTGQPVVEPN